MELPSKTEIVDVWCDGGNGEDSGVEVLRAASCGSSVLSGYSETEAVSECGSDTYTANTVKALAAQLNKQLDLNEAWSESSSLNEENNGRIPVRSKKTSPESRIKDGRARLSARSDIKPKIPAKPTTLKLTPKARKPEIAKSIDRNESDGRWPFSVQRPSRSRATSAVDPGRKSGPASLPIATQPVSNGLLFSNVSMTSSCGPSTLHKSLTQSFSGRSSDGRSSALEMYGTLPRKKKKDDSEVSPALTRSGSREPSLNRAATLRRQTSKEKDNTPSKSLPPYPRGRRPLPPKTLILHEAAVQTTLTAKDLDIRMPLKGSGDVTDGFAQTEYLSYHGENSPRAAKEHVQVLDRVRRLLGLESSNQPTMALLDELERHVISMARNVVKQREELNELNTFKVNAQRELERSLVTQRHMTDQQNQLENEYTELQEFLQAEKMTLSESLVEANDEILRLKEQLQEKEENLIDQQNQCKHLVRLCEQRRQENMGLEARLAGLEQRSQDVLRQQGAAVSGAAVALNSLGARLDSLVDQLAVSYHVADKDLEDVIFHNEAFSEGSADVQPNDSDSNNGSQSQRKKSSFLKAILRAIKSATHSQTPSPAQSRRRSSVPTSPPDQSSESLGLLESELNSDPFSKSSESGDESGTNPDQNSSLYNLSTAILQRQRAEEAEEAYCSFDTVIPPDLSRLFDQVIMVDNLVTKLLKVLRIVQMNNETSMDQISDERAELDMRLRVETTCRQEGEQRLQLMEAELHEARSQLNSRISQLEDAKQLLTDTWQRESQRQYATIDHALETLQGMQEVVDQFPPLGKLQNQLEDCNFRTAAGDDLNANSPNGRIDNAEPTKSDVVRPTT